MTDGIRQFKINGKQVEFSNDKKSASRDLYAQDAQLNSIFEKLNKADANGNIDNILDEKEIKDFQQKIIDAAGKDGDLSSEEAKSLLDSMGLKEIDTNKFFGFIQSMFSKEDAKVKEEVSDAVEQPQESEVGEDEQVTKGIIVQNGESPAAIAKKFGVSLQDLLDANKDALKGKGDKKYFLVGQEIVIPRKIDDEELATLNAGRKSAEETTGDYAQQAAVREQRAAEARQLRAQEEAELKELGMTERAKGEVKAHYSKTPDKTITFKKVANAKNGRSICVDKNGNYVVVAKDGTILKTDFVKNPEKYEQARKLNEEVKTRNGAEGLAKEFYQIADDNSGLNSINRMQKLLDTKVSAKNITQFLDEYDKFKQGDSSIIDTITSEVGASGSIQQKKVLTTLMDKLSQAARQAGVSEDEIKKANAEFLNAYNAEYKSMGGAFRRTNPKDMEKAMDSLRGNILAKQNGTGDVDSAEAIKQFKDLARDEHNSAVKDYNKAREEEGWTARVGDTVCGWFGCNTISDLNKKLGKNKEFVQALVNSKSEAEFREIYKNGITTSDGRKIEGFGVDFDPNKISARQNAIEKYSFALNCDNTIKTADKVLRHADNWDYGDMKTAIRNNFKYDDATIDQIIGGYAQSKGIQNPTDADKKAILVQFLNDTKTNARREFTNIAQGKSLDQMGKDIELITRSAFGTNDIVKDVIQFNENQQITEMVTEAGFEIAGTIALQFVPGLGQMAAARLAVSAARWGTKAVKVVRYAQKAEKVFSTVNKFQKGEAIANATTRSAKVFNKGVQIGSQMMNTGVATAAVDLSDGKSVKETTKKALMNMSFAGVGASSSILAPKLMQAFGIADKALATEIAEEIINAAGSYGVTKLEGGEYGQTDAFVDFASGLIISRISHVGGGKPTVKLQGATTPNVPTAPKVDVHTPKVDTPTHKPKQVEIETNSNISDINTENKKPYIKPETEIKSFELKDDIMVLDNEIPVVKAEISDDVPVVKAEVDADEIPVVKAEISDDVHVVKAEVDANEIEVIDAELEVVGFKANFEDAALSGKKKQVVNSPYGGFRTATTVAEAEDVFKRMVTDKTIDYDDIQRGCVFKNTKNKYWSYSLYQVAERGKESPWKIHLYADSPEEWSDVAQLALPYLTQNKSCSFKTVRDFDHLAMLRSSQKYGDAQKGKAFTIYFKDEQAFLDAAKDLETLFDNSGLHSSGKVKNEAQIGDSGFVSYRNATEDRLSPNYKPEGVKDPYLEMKQKSATNDDVTVVKAEFDTDEISVIDVDGATSTSSSTNNNQSSVNVYKLNSNPNAKLSEYSYTLKSGQTFKFMAAEGIDAKNINFLANIDFSKRIISSKFPKFSKFSDATQFKFAKLYSSDKARQSELFELALSLHGDEKKLYSILSNKDLLDKRLADITELKTYFNKIGSFQYLDGLLDIKNSDPVKFERIKSTGIFDLVKEGKLEAKQLGQIGIHSDLSPEIYSDLELLKSGKSIVPEFAAGTDLKTAFEQTKLGDAVEVGNKMYLNNGNNLIEWNMTKEKYLELFPPVQRFATAQGTLKDCHLVQTLGLSMQNPQARVEFLQSFSLKGDDVVVTVKGLEDYHGSKTFEGGNINLGSKHCLGCKGIQMYEQTYATVALREITPVDYPNIASIDNVMQRVNGGQAAQTMADVFGKGHIADILPQKMKYSLDDPTVHQSSSYSGLSYTSIPYKKDGKTIPVDLNSQSNPKTKIHVFDKFFVDYPDKSVALKGLDISSTEALLTHTANNDNYLISFGTPPKKGAATESPLLADYNIVSNHAYSILGYDEGTKMVKIANPHAYGEVTEIPLETLHQYIQHLDFLKL